MADWAGRFSTRYLFTRVSRSTGNETKVMTMLKGGTITRNSDTRIFESAEVDCVGRFDAGPDLVRIYLEATWDRTGETAEECLGTFLPVQPSREVKGGYSTGAVKLYGRLQELEDDAYGSPVTFTAGTNAVTAAKGICEDAGLTVVADSSSYTLSSDRTYGLSSSAEDADTKLDVVNDLLDLAGFGSAVTDPYGRVLMQRYVEPASRPVAWEFTEGADARFLRTMTDERDTTSVANHVVVLYSSDETDIIGEAWDDDPNSEFSTVSQGRTVTATYEYDDLPSGDTTAEMVAAADAKAASLLSTAQAIIRRITFTHVYCPVTVGDRIQMDYATGGVQDGFAIRTQKLTLEAGCPVEAEARAFER